MGITIPQVVTSDRASGAQVIDGSLNFDENKKYYLERTATDSGSAIYRMTVSWWMKHTKVSGDRFVFNFGSENDLTGWTRFSVQNAGNLNVQGVVGNVRTTALYRDIGWYHYLVSVDTTQSAYNDQVKMYVNGVEIDDWNTTTAFTQNTALSIGENTKHYIGVEVDSNGALRNWLTGTLAQVYVIENQILDASYFGYTDGLTNTWRPKKYEGTFGTNGYYLPMDGSAPIGQDQSGKGNNYTPVNFGGSVSLDNPQVSGARPILNTLLGGTQAGVGVFGSKQNVGYAVTVYDDGGGNKYYIDGVKQDTVTGLIRGATYTFDTSDSTVSSHPFRFSATSNGSHGGGSEYTNGVAAITGAATTITVPHDAPNTLYYYCTSHSGMGADITGITTNEKLADQYASNCVLALPLVGANSDVSASIACTSTTKVMSNVGNAAASSDTSNFYSGSFEFDGTGDGVSTPDNTDFEFGGGDFTVECWVKQDDTSGFDQFVGKYGGSSDGEFIVGKNGNTPTFYWQDSGGNNNINATNFTGNTNSWYHMACVREGNVFTMYINGVCENSTTDATTIKTTSNKLTIGIENDSSSSPFDGYLQDVRIYKGVAKYSGTTVGTQYFVPASTSPDILPDTPSGVSGGSKLTKITEGAVSFDGSGDYLSIADSSDFTVGTNPFTLEFYAYKTAAGEDFFCGSYDSSGTTASLSYAVQTGGSSPTNSLVAHVAEGGSATSVNSGVDFVLNKWVHVAFVRDGNTLRLFQDGIQMSTAAFSGTVNDASNAFEIGRAGFSGKDFPGYISNFRFVNGTALYTANFNPPTRELTNVTNTKLLCCQSVAEQQNNFIRMFRSDTLYTTKADILANATEIFGAEILSNEYWYIVPMGTEPIDGANNKVFSTDAGWGTQSRFYWRDGSSWTKTVGGYSNNDYSTVGGGVGFSYQDNDDVDSYAIYPARDFLVGSQNSGTEPSTLTGNVPSTIKYYKLNGAVKPGTITANGDAAATNFNPFTTDINAVRGQESAYCTWNPLSKANINLSDGNLTAIPGANDQSCFATLSIPDNGKVYFEFTCIQRGGGGAQSPIWGVGNPSGVTLALNPQNSANNASTWLYGGDGNKTGGGSGSTSYGTAFIAGDIIGVCVDRSNSRIWFSKNNVWQNGGNPNNPTDSNAAFTNVTSTGTLIPFYGNNNSTYGYGSVNFGQKPFKYAPPDGFQPLNAANVRPETVITRPDQYVGVTTYNAAGANQIITLGFKPDLIISKARNQSYAWDWEDIVRGGGFKLKSEGTDAQIDYSSNAPIREWRRDGIRASTNLNTTYSAGGSSYGVSYGFVAGNTAIPETGAISFDGTGDYLTFASTSAFLEDAGYTIDGWIYLLSAPANSNGEVIFDTGSGGSDPELNVYADGSGNIQLYESLSNNTNWNGGAAYMKVGRWYYFKQTVDGSSASDAAATHKLYVDGQLGVQNTINLSSRSASSAASIAARTDGSVIGNFILSNLRYRDTVDNSTTIPTAPFTGSEANTVLLCCNKKAPSDDAADPTDSTITPSTITKQGNPGDANITIFGRFTKDGVAHASAAAAGLTGGSITPTGASVGTKQGFSIIKYTGNGNAATIPHGLSQTPTFLIKKFISASSNWDIWTPNIGADKRLTFTNTETSSTTSYQNVNATTFDVHAGNNDNTVTMIAYLWHDVPGLQKFGKYTGVNSTDGPFLELGFRPSLIMFKNITSASTDWVILDNKRNGFNGTAGNNILFPNTAGQENATQYGDFLSNGFKFRINSSYVNAASNDYIYAAWAEAPTFNLYGAQSNAR